MNQMHPHLLAESELNIETIELQHKAYTGDAEAQYRLADIFQKGIGVAKHTRHAFYWYQRAAEQGNLAAQYNVWFAYMTGDGVEINNKEANKWYRRASIKNANSTESVVSKMISPLLR